jgi:hypothetical protein
MGLGSFLGKEVMCSGKNIYSFARIWRRDLLRAQRRTVHVT